LATRTADAPTYLDAEYSVERDGDLLTLVLESASGNAPSRPARNTDYRRALTVFLGRLRDLGATLQDGLVDSALTRRRDIPEPTSSLANMALASHAIGI
jgi:5-methylcytosine-specific restriction protein B